MRIFWLSLLQNFVIFLPIPFLRRHLFNALGWKVDRGARVGLSFIWGSSLLLAHGAAIGHFNVFISVDVRMSRHSRIGHFNRFERRFRLELGESAEVANCCTFKRSLNPTELKRPVFSFGSFGKITNYHYFDVSVSQVFGTNVVIGGRGSEFWTHGFVHLEFGRRRILKLSKIVIGDGVYFGSGCCVNPGTWIVSGANFGARSVIAGDIREAGVYVSAPLRRLDVLTLEDIERRYELVRFSNIDNDVVLGEELRHELS